MTVDPRTPEAVDLLLGKVVSAVTGLPNPTPRQGQVELTHAIHAAMTSEERGAHHAGIAPTGTGKAIAGLVPAALAAVRGERTIVSTESLSLMAQIVDKDFPVVAEATRALFGVAPTIALKKGFGNFACALASSNTLNDALGREPIKGLPADVQLRKLKDAVEAGAMRLFMNGTNIELSKWVLDEALSGHQGAGDRSTFPGEMTDEDWSAVSVSSEDCLINCPFVDVCLPIAARKAANEADVVITNHTLLGIQAANGINIFRTGALEEGSFRHIVVDEAHALPGWVRSQGANTVTEASIKRLASRIRQKVTISTGSELDRLMGQVDAMSQVLSDDLSEAVAAAAPRGAKLGEAIEVKVAEVFESSLVPVTAWCGAVNKELVRLGGILGESSPLAVPINQLANKATALAQSMKDIDQAAPGTARWLQVDKVPRGDEITSVNASPVNVAPLLVANLWRRKIRLDTANPPAPVPASVDTSEMPEPETDVVDPCTVIAMSATLQPGFARDAGLSCGVAEYASPFADAYAGSAAFIPEMGVDDKTELMFPGRTGMDTRSHVGWAAPRIKQLVEANGGSALVLSATVAAGKQYVEMLRRELPNIRVHSQWDGMQMRQVVADWREDRDSVLVGTRSLMTGVDAPGETLSLVIIDRVPRAAGNPVDDARVAALVDEGVASNKWDGDRHVYVSDARLLMDQAVGRLIRGVGDRGMAVVLDPRLLRQAGSMAYKADTRRTLVKPLLRFGHRIYDLDEACQWLAERRAAAGIPVPVAA